MNGLFTGSGRGFGGGPGYGAAMPDTRVPFRVRPLTIVAIAAAVVFVVVPIVYLTMSHPKHALLFFGLAVLALIGAWFSTGRRS